MSAEITACDRKMKKFFKIYVIISLEWTTGDQRCPFLHIDRA